MLKLRWTSITIRTNAQANDMVKQFLKLKPTIGGFDTETNGLHIMLSKPFLFQFGYIHPNLKQGYTYAVDIERQPVLAKQVIKAWNALAKTLDLYFAHNVKYDLHMCENNGTPYYFNNLSDTMFYIRHAHDALTPENGGPPLGLKDYAARYVDSAAKSHEKLLSQEKSTIAKNLNIMLKQRLQGFIPPEKYGAKSYTLKVLEDMFKDPIFTVEDLPDDVRPAYLEWLQQDVPLQMQAKVQSIVTSDMIPYPMLNRDNVIRYAHYDIVYMLEVYLKLQPTIVARQTQLGITVENELILPLFEMERVGFLADKEALLQAQKDVKAYIIKQRTKLFTLAGCVFKIGQHQLIKELLNDTFGFVIDTTNNEEMTKVMNDRIRDITQDGGCPETDTGIQFIKTLSELRTLEKWYSVYIMRFIKDLKFTDRLYTTINQVGTVSGRVTSDFQQFPKDPIKTEDGVELFHPRKVIKLKGTDSEAGIVYLDYSQIELRFQALYTILVGEPDLNLCRAYMPYKCVNKFGELFDCKNIEHIKSWDKEWYYEENPTEHWVATDVHGATTKAAFDIDEHHPDYKHLRYVGKRVNFAKNYGAQYKKICTMFPDRTAEECVKIDGAYYTAFPGVKAYHNYCYQISQMQSYVTNLFGIKYYGVSGHKLINMLVQGSAAYYLKMKIKELHDYSTKHNIHTKWQMQIHDELSWLYNRQDDPEIFFAFKKIMEDWDDALVPIVADMEATTTTWAEKKDVEDLDALQVCLSV